MTPRQQTIIEAVAPYADAANFNIDDVMAAASKAVPDCDPLEVAEAFDMLSEGYMGEVAKIEAELAKRGIAR